MHSIDTRSAAGLAGALTLGPRYSAPAAALAQSGTVAFLMPDQASTRYEEHDYPGFKAEMEKLCPDCTVIYQNANADVALQQQQFNSVIAQGAKVIVLDPVDSAAAAVAGQARPGARTSRSSPMTARSRTRRPTTTSPSTTRASARRSPKSLVEHLKAEGVADGQGRRAADQRLADRRRRRPDPRRHPRGPRRPAATRRSPSSTRRTGRRRRHRNGPAARSPASATEIIGVVAANDGTGGGAIAAFKAAGVNPVPPVTGNDATIAALQLIISGDQYNTISKPSRDRRARPRPTSRCSS